MLISRREEEDLLTGGNFFSENKARWAIFFALKEVRECAFVDSAEVAKAKLTFFKDRSLKEEDESLRRR